MKLLIKNLQPYSHIILAIIVLFIVQASPAATVLHTKVWYILVFFIMLDYFLSNLTNQGFKTNNFITFYFASMVSRMILVLIFLGVGLYYFPENRKLFTSNVIAFYLFFTIFEISNLLRKF